MRLNHHAIGYNLIASYLDITGKCLISAHLHDTEDLANLYATKLHCRALNLYRTLMSLGIIDDRDLTTNIFYVISPTH